MLLEAALSLPHCNFEHMDETHAHFICECGSPFKLRITNKAKDVEEYKCPRCKRHALMLDHVGERYIFKRIKQDARSMARVFDITLEWFVEECHKPCHYCGRANYNKQDIPSKTGFPLLQGFRYNGLDRIDNDIGYVEENCVSCCIVCNRAKNSMPYEDFIEWVNDMIQYRSKV